MLFFLQTVSGKHHLLGWRIGCKGKTSELRPTSRVTVAWPPLNYRPDTNCIGAKHAGALGRVWRASLPVAGVLLDDPGRS
jgi:hypothetical protein